MLKLLDDFFITKIKPKTGWSDSKLNQTDEYYFIYKDFLLELKIQFEIIGYTAEANIAIVNFGYILDIKKWSSRDQRHKWIEELDEQSGKSTKQYFDNVEARKLLLQFIEKSISKYLKNVKPAVVIRGAHNDIKVHLQRYQQLDKAFFENNYIKKEYDIKEVSSLYEITLAKKDDDTVVWTYSKTELFLNQLVDVFK